MQKSKLDATEMHLRFPELHYQPLCDIDVVEHLRERAVVMCGTVTGNTSERERGDLQVGDQ